MAVDAYTIESMAYLTTGLIDTRGAGSGDLRGSEGRGGPVRVFPSFAPLPPAAALAPADQMDMSIEAAACKVRSKMGVGWDGRPNGHVHRSSGVQGASLR